MTAVATSTSNSQVDKQIASMIPSSLENDKAFLNLARSIHSVAYMKLAIFNIRKYMKYRNIDNCERLVHEEPRIIETNIADFLAEGCRDISNNSKRVTLANLKLFYVQNDVSLNWAKLSKRIGRREHNSNRAYHLDEITQMLNHADHRAKVIILLLCSTGMRIAAIPNLNIQDLKPIENAGQKMYAITVYKGEPEEYVTFCTPECAKSIDAYLDFRTRIQEPLKPSSPLIRNEVDLETAENNPDKRLAKRINESGLRHVLEKVVLGSGVRSKLENTSKSSVVVRYDAHLSRAFRKFNYKAMGKAGITPIHKEALIGHKDGISNIEASSLSMIYDSPEESELFVSYLKAVDFLTVDASSRLQTQVNELNLDNQEYKKFLEDKVALLEEGMRLVVWQTS